MRLEGVDITADAGQHIPLEGRWQTLRSRGRETRRAGGADNSFAIRESSEPALCDQMGFSGPVERGQSVRRKHVGGIGQGPLFGGHEQAFWSVALDSSSLVEQQRASGEVIANALEADVTLGVVAVLWWYSRDDGRWRLLCASQRFNELGPLKIYGRLQTLLSENPAIQRAIALDQIWLVDHTHPIIHTLRSVLGSGIRHTEFVSCVIGDLSVDHVLIYFLSKTRAGVTRSHRAAPKRRAGTRKRAG